MLGIRDNFVKVLKKILLLDHKTQVTYTVRRALERAGKYSIREEHDAAFAVHAARWFRPDLIMVDLTSAGPQRLFGIAGKGRIALGYDADLTVVDLKRRETITNEWMGSRAGWTPYHGQTVTGWPV